WFRIVFAQAYADGGVGCFIIQAYAVEYVRWFHRPRRAGRSVGYADAFHIKVEQKHLAVKLVSAAGKRKVDNVRDAMLRTSVNLILAAVLLIQYINKFSAQLMKV